MPSTLRAPNPCASSVGLDPISTLSAVSVVWGKSAKALLQSGVLDRLRNAPPGERIDIVVTDAAYCVSNVLRELVGARLPSVLVGPFGAIIPGTVSPLHWQWGAYTCPQAH